MDRQGYNVKTVVAVSVITLIVGYVIGRDYPGNVTVEVVAVGLILLLVGFYGGYRTKAYFIWALQAKRDTLRQELNQAEENFQYAVNIDN